MNHDSNFYGLIYTTSNNVLETLTQSSSPLSTMSESKCTGNFTQLRFSALKSTESAQIFSSLKSWLRQLYLHQQVQIERVFDVKLDTLTLLGFNVFFRTLSALCSVAMSFLTEIFRNFWTSIRSSPKDEWNKFFESFLVQFEPGRTDRTNLFCVWNVKLRRGLQKEICFR